MYDDESKSTLNFCFFVFFVMLSFDLVAYHRSILLSFSLTIVSLVSFSMVLKLKASMPYLIAFCLFPCVMCIACVSSSTVNCSHLRTFTTRLMHGMMPVTFNDHLHCAVTYDVVTELPSAMFCAHLTHHP